MNKVYIVLVNYNNYADTIECVESILKSSYANFQLFIVDNSTDHLSVDEFSDWLTNNTYQGITTNFSDLVLPIEIKPIDHLIVSEVDFAAGTNVYTSKIIIIKAVNSGFAAANNIVLKYILDHGDDSSLTWMLNNDTVIEKSTLSNLVSFYNNSANKSVVVGAKLRYYYSPQVLQGVAGHYNNWIGKHTHIGDGEKDGGQWDAFEFKNTDYIIGASVFLPKAFIQVVGLMCEDYFLYFEELDWFQRGINKGFTLHLAKDAIVYHKEGASITITAGKKKDTFLAEYYSITNRVKYIKKWYPYYLPTVMVGILWALTKRVLKGKFKLAGKTSAAIFKLLFSKRTPTNKNKI